MPTTLTFDPTAVRADFPALDQHVNGQRLVYLDNAATSQKPRQVIDAITAFYAGSNSNVHRGVHTLSQQATDLYEAGRRSVQRFLNAEHEHEVIYTRGTTEAINLVADTLGRTVLKAGDEVIVTEMEHHSNLVPWHMACERAGARVVAAPVDGRGVLDLEAYRALFNERTKIVAFSHVSNTLGTVNPAEEMIRIAHEHGVPVMVDGAQATPHMPVDVQALDADFYCFSGHKVCGPTGIGVLYGKEAWLDQLPPYQGGGSMIRTVEVDRSTYGGLPHRFEAGTPHIAGAVGLGAAVEYLMELGMDQIEAYEHELLDYANERLSDIDGYSPVGTAPGKAAVLSFTLGNAHPLDVGTLLDQMGIAVRTGHHCTMPLMTKYGIPGTARASLAFYNTKEEIDRLADGLQVAATMLQ